MRTARYADIRNPPADIDASGGVANASTNRITGHARIRVVFARCAVDGIDLGMSTCWRSRFRIHRGIDWAGGWRTELADRNGDRWFIVPQLFANHTSHGSPQRLRPLFQREATEPIGEERHSRESRGHDTRQPQAQRSPPSGCLCPQQVFLRRFKDPGLARLRLNVPLSARLLQPLSTTFRSHEDQRSARFIRRHGSIPRVTNRYVSMFSRVVSTHLTAPLAVFLQDISPTVGVRNRSDLEVARLWIAPCCRDFARPTFTTVSHIGDALGIRCPKFAA